MIISVKSRREVDDMTVHVSLFYRKIEQRYKVFLLKFQSISGKIAYCFAALYIDIVIMCVQRLTT